jgi:hypothetical protein
MSISARAQRESSGAPNEIIINSSLLKQKPAHTNNLNMTGSEEFVHARGECPTKSPVISSDIRY